MIQFEWIVRSTVHGTYPSIVFGIVMMSCSGRCSDRGVVDAEENADRNVDGTMGRDVCGL